MIRLAAESGETDGGCWAWQSIKVTWRKGIESGNVRPILQMTEKSHPELKHVPLAHQYAKTAGDRALLQVINDAHSAAVRPYSLPPGVPQDRVRILQKAFMDTMRDPEFLKEAKTSNLEITPIDGVATGKVLSALYKLDPAMISRLREILVPKKK